jgi:hypothetical protein
VSSEGDNRGETRASWRDVGESQPHQHVLNGQRHIAESAEDNLANALPEEPDALIALVRVCGGVGG